MGSIATLIAVLTSVMLNWEEVVFCLSTLTYCGEEGKGFNGITVYIET